MTPAEQSTPTTFPPIHGVILFAATSQAIQGATVYVRLEDVSRADAAARVVREAVLRDVTYVPGQATPLEWSLEGQALDERGQYAVRVHVDVDGDGHINRGDYISTESYPISRPEQSSTMSVRVQRVE